MSQGVAQSPGFCNCPHVTCFARFVVTGCRGLPLQGATISVAGGATGITDAAGRLTLDVGAAGTYAVTISHPRFVALTVMRTIACNSDVPPISIFTPAAGYHCWTGCAWPLADTLHTSFAAPYDLLTALGGFVWSSADTLLVLDGNSITFPPPSIPPTIGSAVVISCPPALLLDMVKPFIGVVGTITE